jgi:hypothetical protein
MVMDISGTFDYTFVVPDGSRSGTRRIEGTSREPSDTEQKRLIGHAPLLVTEEYQREAWQLYSRITLIPRDRQATVQSFSFSVDRALITMLREGDVLHISRTPCAGLGLSVLRHGQLVAAAGAICFVPLGPDVSIRTPVDLVRQAERIFQTRDPEYQLLHSPVELRIGNVTRIIDGGRPTIGPYEILVRHGFITGLPGTDACVSIERIRVCPDTAAHHSAELMSKKEGVGLIPQQ